MTKLKKILKFQLLIIPTLAVMIYILSIILNHYQNLSYKELSANDFIEKVINNRKTLAGIKKSDKYDKT